MYERRCHIPKNNQPVILVLINFKVSTDLTPTDFVQIKSMYFMLRLHWTTFSLRPYHVLKIQERGEDGVKMKQFRISKFPLRPYYVPATFLLRPHHVLTTSFTFPLRPQYALTKFIPFPPRPCYVLTKTKQFIPRANYVSSTF